MTRIAADYNYAIPRDLPEAWADGRVCRSEVGEENFADVCALVKAADTDLAAGGAASFFLHGAGRDRHGLCATGRTG